MALRRHAPLALALMVVVSLEMASILHGHLTSVVNLFAYAFVLAAAALLSHDEEQRGNAHLLVAGAVCAAISEVDEVVDGTAELGFALRWSAIGLLAWFVLRYPDRSVRVTWHRVVLGLILAVGFVVWPVNAVLWDPGRIGESEPNAWFTVGAWETGRRYLQLIAVWVLSSALVAGAVAVLDRWRRAGGMARPTVRGVAAVGAPLALICAVTVWSEWALPWYTNHPLPDLGVYRSAALALATVVLFAEAVRRRVAALRVIDQVLRATNDTDRLLSVLRVAVADPTARLTGPGSAVDHLPPSRVVLPVLGRGDRRIAALETDVGALIDPAWTRTVLTAAGVVLENAQLHTDVVTSLAEVQSSRARLVEAGLQERRRVERDLHDGAQQHLLAAASSLGRLALTDDDPARRRQALADARSQVDSALAELRRLARGIYPPVLTQAGLAAALRTLPDVAGLPVEVDVADIEGRRWGLAVESTAWFVACEAVANAAKSAAAGRIQISAHLGDQELTICVADDGHGGCRIVPGGGLAGLADRVQALGGDLQIVSEPGHGSLIRGRVPLS